MKRKRLSRKSEDATRLAALEDIRRLLGDDPIRRDLLLEYLHAIQDHYGSIDDTRLSVLAETMRISEAEVYEVASFYAYFDVVRKHDGPPPETTVRVCDSLTCTMFGAEELLEQSKLDLEPTIRVTRASCMGRCDQAPVAVIANRHVTTAGLDSIKSVLQGTQEKWSGEVKKHQSFSEYVDLGGYKNLRAIRDGRLTCEDVVGIVMKSELKGLGGAGFPTGKKWSLVSSKGNALMAVNADEGEPGTFKDRHILTTMPHQFFEGMLIAAAVANVTDIFIYLRAEYPDCYVILQSELGVLKKEGLTVGINIHLRRGAGAYICGEESAMLESLEGKRGEPRHKPPFPSEKGLFGQPTLINNVETLYWIPEIIGKGADWFVNKGRAGGTGLRFYSVSGRVSEPGVKLAPVGITARELIECYSGGISKGHVFRAYLPGGASGGLLPASLADIPLDFGKLDQYGCFVGSGALIVLGEKDSIIDVNKNLMRFFEDESCGQCTPCRLGCGKMLELMAEPKWNEDLIRELSEVMSDASICGLGQAAPTALMRSFEFFRDDLPT